MKQLLAVLVVLAFVAGFAYAANENKGSEYEPVKTLAEDTGAVVQTAAQGVADTVNVQKNNPVTTAVEATGKVAEEGVKTVTLQKTGKGSGCN